MHVDVDIPCSDPSDVTELIGSGKADPGTKAMIHTIAGKARGYPIKSIGTLMDEPFTGVLYLEVTRTHRRGR
jgi:pyrimidine precursor biosynthesis enzyme